MDWTGFDISSENLDWIGLDWIPEFMDWVSKNVFLMSRNAACMRL